MATYPAAGSANWYAPLKTYIDETAAEAVAAGGGGGGGGGGPVAWGDITGVPSTFTPSSHSHPAAEVTESGTRVFVSPAQKAKIDASVTSSSITQIVTMTQAAYDALSPKVATTLYIING